MDNNEMLQDMGVNEEMAKHLSDHVDLPNQYGASRPDTSGYSQTSGVHSPPVGNDNRGLGYLMRQRNQVVPSGQENRNYMPQHACGPQSEPQQQYHPEQYQQQTQPQQENEGKHVRFTEPPVQGENGPSVDDSDTVSTVSSQGNYMQTDDVEPDEDAWWVKLVQNIVIFAVVSFLVGLPQLESILINVVPYATMFPIAIMIIRYVLGGLLFGIIDMLIV